MNKQKLKRFFSLFLESWQIFKENHPGEFASAIAYFSLFGLPSIFVIVIFCLSFFFETNTLYHELQKQLAVIIGEDSANILGIITERYMIQASKNIWLLIAYTFTVLSLATQLLVFFQDILNNLWQVKPAFKSFWKKMWVERGLTFILVLATGILFFANVALERGIEYATGGETGTNDPIVILIINILTILFVWLWFAVLYKILPFVKIKWEPTIVGAAITTLLFLIGIWLLSVLVVDEGIEDLYDYAAPIVLVALWLFYNSLAFFYGASFTKAYARMRGKHIEPAHYAYRFKWVKDKDFDNKL
ncbi:YihY/virulence factor BrkB family protein [Cytophagaceae bacterium ABcell3]|nr:YihY/virulence factor BrkB family protein [Cytophagaceae bacterium ABcell3]